jgi:3-oxoacyl-[acyl-carrier-protein] synthase II
MRRVVVTGIGMVSPLGCGVDVSWQRLIAGESASKRIEDFDVSNLACQIACQVSRGENNAEGEFNPDRWMAPKDQRKVDDFIIYAVAAADMALADAEWKPENYADQIRSGVIIGSGIGGLQGIEKTSLLLAEKGPRRVSPFFIPGRLINLASGQVSIRHALKGPNHSVVTACSTGTHAIGDAFRMIAMEEAEVMVAGGAESPICRLAIAGFAASKALSTGFNDEPQRASRPYDRDRDGFVMGDGAGVMVLEELEHARNRGARIYAEIIGYGLSGDAFHITAPASDGDGAYRCMRAAVNNAGIAVEEIDYVNAHGTSTPMGDEIELRAVERLFGDAAKSLAMSSTKSAIGHLLGAAGAVEAIFSVLAIRDNVLPPTLNLDNPDVDTNIDLVPHVASERNVDTVLSNSFGFGGTNASIIFRHINS